jgi:hypothetical protein
VQVQTNLSRGVGIHRAVARLDVPNNPVLINHDIRAQGHLGAVIAIPVRFQDSVRSEHFVVHIAQKRELHINLLGKNCVRWRAIDAYTEYCCVIQVDLTAIDSRLDRLELFRSTTGERQNVHREKNVFLPLKVAELNRLVLIAGQ